MQQQRNEKPPKMLRMQTRTGQYRSSTKIAEKWMPKAMRFKTIMTILIAPRPVRSPGDVSSPSRSPDSQMTTTHSFQNGNKDVLPQMGQMGMQLVRIWNVMKKMCDVRWQPNFTIGVLLYLLSRGRENTTQSGGTTESMAKKEKILVPLQCEMPPFQSSQKYEKIPFNYCSRLV